MHKILVKEKEEQLSIMKYWHIFSKGDMHKKNFEKSNRDNNTGCIAMKPQNSTLELS